MILPAYALLICLCFTGVVHLFCFFCSFDDVAFAPELTSRPTPMNTDNNRTTPTWHFKSVGSNYLSTDTRLNEPRSNTPLQQQQQYPNIAINAQCHTPTKRQVRKKKKKKGQTFLVSCRLQVFYFCFFPFAKFLPCLPRICITNKKSGLLCNLFQKISMADNFQYSPIIDATSADGFFVSWEDLDGRLVRLRLISPPNPSALAASTSPPAFDADTTATIERLRYRLQKGCKTSSGYTGEEVVNTAQGLRLITAVPNVESVE